MTEQTGSNWTSSRMLVRPRSRSDLGPLPEERSMKTLTALLGVRRIQERNVPIRNQASQTTAATNQLGVGILRSSFLETIKARLPEDRRKRFSLLNKQNVSKESVRTYDSDGVKSEGAKEQTIDQKVAKFKELRDRAKRSSSESSSSEKTETSTTSAEVTSKEAIPQKLEGVLGKESRFKQIYAQLTKETPKNGKIIEQYTIKKESPEEPIHLKKESFVLKETFFTHFYDNFSVSKSSIQKALEGDIEMAQQKLDILDAVISQLKDKPKTNLDKNESSQNQLSKQAAALKNEWTALHGHNAKKTLAEVEKIRKVQVSFKKNLENAKAELEKTAPASPLLKSMIEEAKKNQVTVKTIEENCLALFHDLKSVDLGRLARDISRAMFAEKPRFIMNGNVNNFIRDKIIDYKINNEELRLREATLLLKGLVGKEKPNGAEIQKHIATLSPEDKQVFEQKLQAKIKAGIKVVNETLFALDRFKTNLEDFLAMRHTHTDEARKQALDVIKLFDTIVAENLAKENGNAFDMNLQEKIYGEFLAKITMPQPAIADAAQSTYFFMKCMSQNTGNDIQSCIITARGASKNPLPSFKPLDRLQVLDVQSDGRIKLSAQVRCQDPTAHESQEKANNPENITQGQHEPDSDPAMWMLLTLNEMVFSPDLKMIEHEAKTIAYIVEESTPHAEEELKSYAIATDIPMSVQHIKLARFKQLATKHLSELKP